MPILKIDQLSKSYQTGKDTISVLENLSMSVNEGEMVAVMGPSGSGKTTLLHLASGMDVPDCGSVWIKGENITELNPDAMALFRRKHIGMIFQNFQLLESLNVQENILLPLAIDETEYELQMQKLENILNVLEIIDLRDKNLNEISGGQKQKVAIGRALVQDPEILFADEPTGNLDLRSTAIVMKCMRKMNKELGVAFMIVTHDVYTASFCDRVLLLREGKFVQEVSYGKAQDKTGSDQKMHFIKENRIEYQDRIIRMLQHLGGEEDDFC